MFDKNRHFKLGLLATVFLFFLLFLLLPICLIFIKSVVGDEGFSWTFLQDILSKKTVHTAFKNSVLVSLSAATITSLLAFIVAYTVNYTTLPAFFKKLVAFVTMLPMFLPTITYGYAIIYSFGAQGLFTRSLSLPTVNIYGWLGLTTGFVIYTLPIAFLLINNSMKYTDKRLSLVSILLKDSTWRTFKNTIMMPIMPALFISLIQCFFLAFTDFGIPTSLGGRVTMISDLLYEEMMGSAPDFNRGAVIALLMALPALISLVILKWIGSKQILSDSVSQTFPLKKNPWQNVGLASLSLVVIGFVLSLFLIVFILPFIGSWPYNLSFTLRNFSNLLSDRSLIGTYWNSIMVAFITAALGTFLAMLSALFTGRQKNRNRLTAGLTTISSLVSTIPGMVLGIAYLLTFSGTALQGSFAIIIICNIIHYFATPYLTIRDSLAKLNQNWEITAELLGDSWVKTIVKVLLPNILPTIAEIFRYYFINSTVTVSGVIFLVNAKTMLITTKIKELQYFGRYNEVFVLSLFILATNLIVYLVSNVYIRKEVSS